MPAGEAPPPGGRGWRRGLAWGRAHGATLLFWGVLLWASPRLLPHVGALLGVRTGAPDAPVAAVTLLDGRPLALADLRGRVVLVNVWATWCAPCRVEMPLLEQTWRRHRAAGFTLLGASVDRGDPATVRAFLVERGISYPVAIVGPEVVQALGGVVGYPTSILIGRDGRVRHRVMGPIGPLTLEPAIRRALAEPVPAPPPTPLTRPGPSGAPAPAASRSPAAP